MERLGQGIVKLRHPILLVTFAVVICAGVVLPRLTIDVSSRNLLFVDEAVRKKFNRYLDEWGTDRWHIMGVKFTKGDAFTAERLAYIRWMTARLARIKGVLEVQSITNTAAMSAKGDELFIGPLVPDQIPRDPKALDEIRRRTLSSPLLRRSFVNDEGTMVALNMRLEEPGKDERKIMETAQVVERLRKTVSKPPHTELYVMGGPAMLATMYEIIRRDLWVLTLAPILLVGLILLVVFRSVRGALLPLAVVLSTGAITFGGMAASGHNVNLVTTMLPCLMMVIGVADVIHVLVQHREAVLDGLDPRAAVVETVKRVGLPVFLTSATTAVGFGSLVLSDVPQVREFGIFAAIGVMVAMLLSIVSVPAALCLLPQPRPGQAKRLTEGAVSRALFRVYELARRRRWAVIAVSVAVAIFGGLGLLRLEAESSTREYLPKDHPLRTQFAMVESHLMGGVPVILHVQDRRPLVAAAPRPETEAPAPLPAKAPTGEGADELVDDPEDDLAKDRPAGAAAQPAPAPPAKTDDEVVDDPEDDLAKDRPARAAPRPASAPAPARKAADEVIDDPEDDLGAKHVVAAKARAATSKPRARAAPPPGKQRLRHRERLRDPQVLGVIDEISTRLSRLKYVRKVISITEYLKEVNRVMHGGDPKHFRLPTDRRVIAAYLEMAAGRDREGMERLVNWEYSKANVTVMCAWPNTRRIRRVLSEVNRYLARPDVKRRLGKDVTVEVTGVAPMLANVADKMVNGQIKSFFMALVIICIMMVAVLWSFRVGLLAMIPNVLPILLTMGLMGWLDITLNVTTVMIASIALGIAVDDTIHMLVRMRSESRQRGSHEEGVQRALQSVGRAVVFTSVVLSGGFAILLLASLVPAAHFGILIAFTMLTALLADLVLTPVLILWLKPWVKPSAGDAE
ncbi:MAG: efflux RND transporter permease subunit [bacterium]